MNTKRKNFDNFINEICGENRPYTPKEVLDYIEGTRQIKFASPEEKEKIIGESTGKLKSLVIKYGIRLYTPLQFKTSDAGRDLARLTLSHCNELMGLINEEEPYGLLLISSK